MIIHRIRESILPGQIIPKPRTTGHTIKGWGMRRGEAALVYFIPTKNSATQSQKGITESEFEIAFSQLKTSGEFTRNWFNEHLPQCAKEGPCNFTTIGGIFMALKEAVHSGEGRYMSSK